MRRAFFLFVSIVVMKSSIAFAGNLITATEVQNCFYADGKMECKKGEFRNTYSQNGDKILRTSVFNLKKKKTIPDDTEYTIMTNLASDPKNNDGALFPKVIRAIGSPGTDAVEILVIEDKYIQSVKSTSNYMVISRFRIDK